MVYDDYDGLIYRKAPFSSWSCVRKSNNTLTSFQRRMYSKSSHNKYLKNFSSHIRHGCVCNCATIPQKDYEKYHWIGATWWQSRFSRVLSWESIGIEGKSCFRETRQSPLAMPDFLRIWPLETRKKYIHIYIYILYTYIYIYICFWKFSKRKRLNPRILRSWMESRPLLMPPRPQRLRSFHRTCRRPGAHDHLSWGRQSSWGTIAKEWGTSQPQIAKRIQKSTYVFLQPGSMHRTAWGSGHFSPIIRIPAGYGSLILSFSVLAVWLWWVPGYPIPMPPMSKQHSCQGLAN